MSTKTTLKYGNEVATKTDRSLHGRRSLVVVEVKCWRLMSDDRHSESLVPQLYEFFETLLLLVRHISVEVLSPL